MHSNIRTIIPVRGPFDIEVSDENYELLLSEITNLGKEKKFIHLIDYKEKQYKKIIQLNIRVVRSSKEGNNVDTEIELLKKRYNFFKIEWIEEYLEFEFTFSHKLTIFTEIIINNILKRLSLLLHLSYNTKIDFLPGLIFYSSNSKRLIGKTEMLLSDIDMAYGHAIRINWPTIKQPTIKQTVNWFIDNDFHTDDLSQTKLQRAINAFSYSFSTFLEKETSELFWTMIGIEALLAEGSSNIISQIKSKTSIILKEPKEFKKKLEKLYNYRSRLVHGDLNFPPKFSSDYEEFEREYWDYSQFALSILIALMKELIIENKIEFKFEYKRIK